MKVADYYDKLAADYHKQYDGTSEDYPANAIRLKHIISRLKTLKAQSVYEIGVGEGTPLKEIRDTLEIAVAGCDVSSEMVGLARKTLGDDVRSPISHRDMETVQEALIDYDVVIASGVLPHIQNEDVFIQNIHGILNRSGSAIVEFRNSLFSVFTFNWHTINFIMELLTGVSDAIRLEVYTSLTQKLNPPFPYKSEFDKISRFHNPFVLQETFAKHGFQTTGFIWYHAHPAPPYLEESIGEEFRKEALKLEKGDDWRGMFMCSAGLIEVKKQ